MGFGPAPGVQPARIVGSLGANLGAAQTITFSGAEEVWLLGTLNADLTVTLAGRVANAELTIFASQDGAGGHTLSISDGTSAEDAGISDAASAAAQVECVCVNSTDVRVVVQGAAGSSQGSSPIGVDDQGIFYDPSLSDGLPVSSDSGGVFVLVDGTDPDPDSGSGSDSDPGAPPPTTQLAYALPTASNGLAKTPLPAGAAYDTTNVAAAAAALVAQANATGGGAYAAPVMNVTGYSGLFYVLPNDQPLVRVKVLYPIDNTQFAIGDSGVPVPADATPQGASGDTDSECFVYQPLATRGPGGVFKGLYYEFWRLNRATGQDLADGYAFTCHQLTRMIDANNNLGRIGDYFYQVGATYDNPGTDPYSSTFQDGRIDQRQGVMQYASWGALAIGANPPGACLMVHPADILRATADGKTGICDHVLGLEIADCRAGFVWPARRGDGILDESYPVIEGQWYRFAADGVMPTNLSPMGELLWRTTQKFGFIVSDKTVSCLAFRAAPDCNPLLVSGQTSHDGRDWSAYAFQNFPWGDLKLLKVGSDSNFHPTT